MTFAFDLDGTLIDSSDRHYLLMKKIISDEGIDIPDEFDSLFMNYKFSGKSGKEFLLNIMGLNEDLCQKINQIWIDNIEKSQWIQFDTLFFDVDDMCRKCLDKGVRIVYLTYRVNSIEAENEIISLGLDKYAQKWYILNPQDKVTKKDILSDIAKKDRCLMIGDTELDYDAAREAGVDCYIVNRGFRGPEFWAGRGIVTYKDLTQLEDYVVD